MKQQVELKKLKMTREIIHEIIEIDKEFYKNFDYSDDSWYLKRYNRKTEVTAITVGGKIVGYFLFLKISKKLFFQICNKQYKGDYYFPESELNANTDLFYLSSVLVKEEFREFSPLLLRRLFREFNERETVVTMTISSTGKRMAEKYMTCIGNIKENMYIFLKTKNLKIKEKVLKLNKTEGNL